MSDDNYRDEDNEYWDNVYYYEKYEKELNETGSSSSFHISGAFWIWLIVLLVASNISTSLGEAVIYIGLVCWIISKFIK